VTENSEKGYSDIKKLIIELENIFLGYACKFSYIL
jgi:hypothetical protein